MLNDAASSMREESLASANHDLPELEETCIYCEGSGEVWNGRAIQHCAICRGAGHTPTPFGEKVLAFIQRRGGFGDAGRD